MSEIRVNGVSLYFEEHGTGNPILCIHGTGSSALIWSDAVAELARRGRVIVYDRRGCTRSQRPDPYDATTAREHADDAAALLEALGARHPPWSSAAATAVRSPWTSCSDTPTSSGPWSC